MITETDIAAWLATQHDAMVAAGSSAGPQTS
jgi:hypothetical protein